MSLEAADLEAFRQRTDEALDEPVMALSRQQIGRMLGVLFRSDHIPESDADLGALLERLPPVVVEDPVAVAEGQKLFRLFGPECLLILGCYSLPAAYAVPCRSVMTTRTLGSRPLSTATMRLASALVVSESRYVPPTWTARAAWKYGGSSSSRMSIGSPRRRPTQSSSDGGCSGA